MSWAEVMKINSDMTMPLDELIRSQRSLGASDAVMAVPISSNISISNGEKRLLATFKPSVNGSVRITASMRRGTSSDFYAVLSLEENGLEKAYVRTDNYTHEVFSFDVEVLAEKTYKIYLRGERGGQIDSLKICASVIDTSLLGYTIGG